ncbi:MAG: hypothetical protein JRG96_20325 [Deltaproteobacteria bacterium]|nr:hypothetical protein [Deltaproteobacteria bacterium]
MTAAGRQNAVGRLCDRALSGGASNGLSTALSLGFGALLLAFLLAGPHREPESLPEPPASDEATAATPPVPTELPEEAGPGEVSSVAMARIALPPPPPGIAAPRPPSPSIDVEPVAPEPTATESNVAESTVAKPNAAKPNVAEPNLAKPTVTKPTVAKPTVTRTALSPLAPSAPAGIPLALGSEPAKKLPAKPSEAAQSLEAVVASAPGPAAPSVAIQVGDAAAPEAVEGRVLLHILEHGSGPGIVIAWPRSTSEQAALYSLLTGCYGVRTALLDSAGRLYRADRAGAWTPNTDRYSGFLRQVEGRLPAGESGAVADIRRRNPGARSSSTVRLFPRNVDAVLLGGLRGIVGDRYGDASRISASYARSGQTVLVRDVRVDGAALTGSVALTPPRYCPAAGST